MRDIADLNEHEAELVHRLIEVYPAGLGYTADREPPMRELAAQLIEEGRVERVKFVEGGQQLVSYRLTNEHAEEIRRTAAEKARCASEN